MTVEIDDAAVDALFADPEGPVGDAIEEACLAVEAEAKRSLTSGGGGRVYDTRFWRDAQGRLRVGRRRPPHQASAPGQPPASDTGRLLNSIGHSVSSDGKVYGVVEATADYSLYLELGTRYMQPRPFLRPALAVLGEQ